MQSGSKTGQVTVEKADPQMEVNPPMKIEEPAEIAVAGAESLAATLSAESDPASTDLGELKRKSVRGAAMAVTGQIACSLIQLFSGIVLARMLSPQDYGIIAMVMIVTSFAALFGDMGLSAAAVRHEGLTHGQRSNFFWLNVLMGSLLTIIVAVASPLVAWFFHSPELLWATVALSTIFFITSFGSQHGALMVREMRFGQWATANISGAVCTMCMSIVLASIGLGYWALVGGALAGSACTTLMLTLLSPFRPGRPRKGSGVRELIKFGAHVTAFDFVNYFHRNLDNVLIGRFCGADMLGLYSRAYSLLMFPINNLRGPVNAVAYPAMSKLQHEPAAFRAYYRRTISLLATFSMPLTAFLFVAARPIIELLLGRHWIEVAPIFAWLALAGFVQPVSGMAGTVMLCLGKSRDYLRVGILTTALMSLSFVVGLKWGATGVALAYAIANYVILYPWISISFRGTPVSFRDFAASCAFPAAVSIIAGALAVAARNSLGEMGCVRELMVCAAGFALPLATTLLVTRQGRKTVAQLGALLKHLRST